MRTDLVVSNDTENQEPRGRYIVYYYVSNAHTEFAHRNRTEEAEIMIKLMGTGTYFLR